MDCNRDEALRAKQLAEKKMESKDFSSALKIAVKAQQLYPELENVSQMILVCEVHCSAEKKAYGNEKDWYGILKIEPSADDLSIKKQYRKLALVLHPDKNKFSGSADAFKLIGEAQRVLLDREKRMIHDSKRKAFANPFPRQPSRQPQHPWNQSSFAQGHSVNPHFQNNFPGGRSGNFPFSQPRPQTGVGGNRPTFWTVCPFCSVRYQFYRDDVLNKVIHCQNCKKSFTAYELNVQGGAAAAAPPGGRQVPVFPQHNTAPFRATVGTNSSFTTKPVFGGDNFRPKQPPNSANRKRKKKVQESSESSDSESSSESEEEDVEEGSDGSENTKPKNSNNHSANPDFQHFGEPPRRSLRPKRNVSYKENLNENDDEATPSNKAKKRDSSSHTTEPKLKDSFWKAEVTKVEKEDDEKESQLPDPKNDDVDEAEPEVYECPDPEFSDFDKDRKEESFHAGQIWAVYDNVDAMPRFYAYIRKVVSPGFKLQITWLEPVPENEEETKWVEDDFPVSCGNFKRGRSDKAEDLPMFSHLVSWESQKTYYIVPRTGETWALFKNWCINGSGFTLDGGARKYEYEFVEILEDYDDEKGVRVSYLEKMKGFVSVFGRREGREGVVPAGEKLRFSHMVPSCRMSGEEREGVPKGSYELDPAALPASTFEQVSL